MKSLFFFSILFSVWAQATSLELINECNLETGSKAGSFEIGGLSGLHYSEKKNLLMAVSDFKRPTDAHVFLFATDLQPGTCPLRLKAITLKEKVESQDNEEQNEKQNEKPKEKWQRFDSDVEAISFDDDGTLFISSEWGQPGSRFDTEIKLFAFSQDAKLRGEIPVPLPYQLKTYRIPPGPKPTKSADPVLVLPELVLPPRPVYEYNSTDLKKKTPDIIETLWKKIELELWRAQVRDIKKEHARQVEITLQKHKNALEQNQRALEAALSKWENDHTIRKTGPQHNAGFEAMSFDPKSRILTGVMEDALQQDPADVLRVLRIQLDKSKTPIQNQEFYYQPDENNRVSEMIDLGNGHLLILEIFFDTQETKVYSKIFEVQLPENGGRTPVLFLEDKVNFLEKKLVLDLNTLNIRLDNLEGMTLGPKFDDGSSSLILVSDNNRSRNQTTQFLFFKMK